MPCVREAQRPSSLGRLQSNWSGEIMSAVYQRHKSCSWLNCGHRITSPGISGETLSSPYNFWTNLVWYLDQPSELATLCSTVKQSAALKLECTWKKLILGKILIFILLPSLLKHVTWAGAVFFHTRTFFVFCPTSNGLPHSPHYKVHMYVSVHASGYCF